MKTVAENRESKKQAYVFPGQGSQSVGMGQELFSSSPSAREVFEEADESLGYQLSDLIFQGPSQELQNTIHSQPGIMTVSIASWKAWQEMDGAAPVNPVVVAGHSLGEYTAMVVAGVIGFGDAVKLVRERGRLMQEASVDRPGGMAAIIGLNEFALEQICSETGVELANINSDDQIVVSGDRIAVARAMDLASARGARRAITPVCERRIPLLAYVRRTIGAGRGCRQPGISGSPVSDHCEFRQCSPHDRRGGQRRVSPGAMSMRPVERLCQVHG